MLSFGRWLLASAALSPVASLAMTCAHGDHPASDTNAVNQSLRGGSLSGALELDSTWPDTISMVFSHEDPLDIVIGDAVEESAFVTPSNQEPESDGWALMGLVLALWGLLHSRRLNAA